MTVGGKKQESDGSFNVHDAYTLLV